MELLPTVAEALIELEAAGYERIVVSNQSGVARGFFDEAAVMRVEEALSRHLAAAGAAVEAFYRCPHLDEGCDCRKPLPGMIRQAARERGLDLSRSVMIGDRGSDVAAGKAAGVPGVLVTTGPLAYDGPAPDYIAASLADAAHWIISRDR